MNAEPGSAGAAPGTGRCRGSNGGVQAPLEPRVGPGLRSRRQTPRKPRGRDPEARQAFPARPASGKQRIGRTTDPSPARGGNGPRGSSKPRRPLGRGARSPRAEPGRAAPARPQGRPRAWPPGGGASTQRPHFYNPFLLILDLKTKQPFGKVVLCLSPGVSFLPNPPTRTPLLPRVNQLS